MASHSDKLSKKWVGVDVVGIRRKCSRGKNRGGEEEDTQNQNRVEGEFRTMLLRRRPGATTPDTTTTISYLSPEVELELGCLGGF